MSEGARSGDVDRGRAWKLFAHRGRVAGGLDIDVLIDPDLVLVLVTGLQRVGEEGGVGSIQRGGGTGLIGVAAGGDRQGAHCDESEKTLVHGDQVIGGPGLIF